MIQIKNRYTGDVILEIEGDTLVAANLRNADLSNADLSNADLRNANLRDADLRNADFWKADLWKADLRKSDLSGCKMPIYCKWPVAYLLVQGDQSVIRIGCIEKTIAEWDAWFAGTDQYETPRTLDGKANPDFVRIEAMYKAYRAYVLHVSEYLPEPTTETTTEA